ncbi:hypothetical protein JXB31_02205 [Candidatus Woesearchaeota archaeon]|nr:hypothetical protein [Candidatus Woesearchaeota archaeon]
MADSFDYEDSKVENIQIRTFYCGLCKLQMVEVSRRDACCPKCGKQGWMVSFVCPKCGAKAEAFYQDLTTPPFCYCDNP